MKVEKKLELSTSRGLRISQEMKAIRIDQQIFPPGETIADRYKLGEMIGKGPFGEVYRAFDEVIGSDIALKLFKRDLIKTPHDQDAFLRGMDSIRKETHEKLVRIHASGVHKEHPWVASQLLEGLSLRKVISLRIKKNEKFEISELDAVLSQVQDAVDTQPDKLHGDLKPENIVFLPDTLKITDTFISHVFSAENFKSCLSNSPYLAPEYEDLKTEKRASADVYSLGLIIAEMLLGSDYEEGKILPTGISAAVDYILKKATDRNPENRFADIGELREAFKTRIMDLRVVPPPSPVDINSSQNMIAVSSDDLPLVGDAETTEYNRKIETEIQNHILTKEVRRKKTSPGRPNAGPHPVAPVKTETAIVAPVPAVAQTSNIPSGRAKKGDDDNNFPFALMFGLLVVVGLVALYFGTIVDDPIELGGNDNDVELKVPKTELSKSEEKNVVKTTDPTIVPDAPVAKKNVDAPNLSTTTTGITDNGKTKEVSKETTPPLDAQSDTKTIGANGKLLGEVSKGTQCPNGLKLKKRKWGNYCIARYEFPGAGSKPKTNVSWFAAKKSCEARNQRLCKSKEWRSACGSTYPYGKTFDANKCNSVDEDGFDRGVARSGSFRECKNAGVYDLVGNVHEWTAEQKIVGGGYESDESVASCRYSSSKSPGSSAGYIGFRCCADPE